MKPAAFLPIAWAIAIALLPATADAAAVCAPPLDYALLDSDSQGIGGTGRSGPADSGIGGTGRSGQDGSGIGGTGHAESMAGGIGGTGRSGDPGGDGGIGGTGIVGTITGFASICVNGLEVHYDEAVPVSANGKPANARSLAIGQVVAVEAGNSPRGLEARRIAVLHALEGPVTRGLDQRGQIEVMGARVSFDHPRSRDQASQLKAGDWVQVSGHRTAGNGVLASRVARIAPQSEASVSGRADATRQQVGGVAVDRPGNGELTVRGAWDGQRIRVRDSRASEGTMWIKRPGRVVIETRVQQRDGRQIRTGRADIDAVLAARSDRVHDLLTEGALIRVTARIDNDGKLRPLRIERALREDSAPRSGSSKGRGESGGRADDERASSDGKESRDSKEGRDGREGKDAAKGQEKQQRDNERLQRNERDAAERRERSESRERNERNDKVERVEKIERIEKVERSERSGRDH